MPAESQRRRRGSSVFFSVLTLHLRNGSSPPRAAPCSKLLPSFAPKPHVPHLPPGNTLRLAVNVNVRARHREGLGETKRNPKSRAACQKIDHHHRRRPQLSRAE